MKSFKDGIVYGVCIIFGLFSFLFMVLIFNYIPLGDDVFTWDHCEGFFIYGFICGGFISAAVDALFAILLECRSHFPRIDIKITKKGVNE